jgi:plasmid stability protein
VVATLHIRNVPKSVYDALKRSAERNGRSLNMEVIEVLDVFAAEERRSRSLLRRLDELRAECLLPDDAPSAAEVIRQARDARASDVERRARGL